MSGGVDSSVAALLLQQQGYEVVGVTLRVLPDVSQESAFDAENDPSVVRARAIAEKLGIEHHVANCSDAFTGEVLKRCHADFSHARTPNPCCYCNRFIKFGWMMDYAKSLGADFLATGHYVRIEEVNGVRRLLRGRDPGKDQSYFLFWVPDERRNHVLTPLGTYVKCSCGEIRTEDIEALGHLEEAIPAVPATYDSTGLSEGKKCSRCGEILVPQNVIAKLQYTLTVVAENCSVSKDDNNVETIKVDKGTSSSLLSSLTVTPIDNYHFVKWQMLQNDIYVDIPENATVQADMTIKPLIEINTYTVSWKNADGSFARTDENVEHVVSRKHPAEAETNKTTTNKTKSKKHKKSRKSNAGETLESDEKDAIQMNSVV